MINRAKLIDFLLAPGPRAHPALIPPNPPNPFLQAGSIRPRRTATAAASILVLTRSFEQAFSRLLKQRASFAEDSNARPLPPRAGSQSRPGGRRRAGEPRPRPASSAWVERLGNPTPNLRTTRRSASFNAKSGRDSVSPTNLFARVSCESSWGPRIHRFV